jgi:hypothetical protein
MDRFGVEKSKINTMKQLLTLTFLSIFGLTFAQIPSYVPSNGLVGWWPFNGNANDESGNGNNGTVNGALLTSDRNGVANSAYSFDGVDDRIEIAHNSNLNNGAVSISIWYNATTFLASNGFGAHLISKRESSGWGNSFQMNTASSQTENSIWADWTIGSNGGIYHNSNALNTNTWFNVVYTHDLTSVKLYINGLLVETIPSPGILGSNNLPLWFGARPNAGSNSAWYSGKLDDSGIWNRALTEAEILALYEGCQLAITTQPQDQSVATSVGTASFTAASSSSNATYQWQTNLGLGYQNLSNAGQYSGAASSILTVSNLSMSNNNQVFRCVVNDGGCVDTTSEAILTIIDDAGIQNNTVNSLKLYPNPVQDVIHIDGLAGKEFEYEVLSIEGKLLQKGKSQGEIAVKELRKGNYVLRIGEQQVSFVKQ